MSTATATRATTARVDNSSGINETTTMAAATVTPTTPTTSTSINYREPRDQVSLSRRLRRIKRRLFLEYVEGKNRTSATSTTAGSLSGDNSDCRNHHHKSHQQIHHTHHHNFKAYAKPVVVSRRVGVVSIEPSNHTSLTRRE